ncbi:MAG: helix-turn-helix transcriptional regulator [Thermoleophilaceae bacterium]
MEVVANTTAVRVAIVSAEPRERVRIDAEVEHLGYRVSATSSTVFELPQGSAGPEIVVLALAGSRATDTKAIGELRERVPEARLLLVMPDNSGRDRRAASIGADGIIYASALDRMLAPALAALTAGLAVLPHELNASRLSPTLSSREKQVLAMVVMGFTNIEIAAKLFLAESTVKSHLSSAFRKLGVTSRKDAAARILDPESGLGPGILAISGNGIAALAAQGPQRNGSAVA